MRARLRPRSPDRGVRRRPWREAPYAALDFETTGLDYARDTIVSFGVVPVNSGRVVVGEAVHQLVDPAVPPSPASQRVHELRPQDLAGSPPLEAAREMLGRAIDGRFLPLTPALRVAVAFGVQLVDAPVPAAAFDLAVDAIVTETETIRCVRD